MMDILHLAERSFTRWHWRSRVVWWAMMVLAVAIGLVAVVPYLLPSPARFEGPIIARFASAPLFELASLYLHTIPAGIALLLGPLQFVTRLRTARPRLHRWTGRV